MTDNLPPLPKGDITYYITDSTMRIMACGAHSDSQMQAYASTAIDAALAARGAVPAGWADEIIGLIEEYGSERATGAYHGEHFCHQTPADLLKKIRAMLATAPQQVAQPTTCKHCGGLGYTEKGGYQLHCICQMSADDLAQTINKMFASAQAKPEQAAQPNLLSWAVDRWLAEVSNRPLVNKNRRTLDDTWRQVIRFAGGDPDELIGPCHDTLLAAAPQPKD